MHRVYFSEGLQLIINDTTLLTINYLHYHIVEVARSQFLLITFISQPAFSHLFVAHLFSLIQYLLIANDCQYLHSLTSILLLV